MDLVIKLAVFWTEYVLKQIRWKVTRVSYVVAYFARLVPNYNSARRHISEDYWIMLQKRCRSPLDLHNTSRTNTFWNAQVYLQIKCKDFTQS